MGQTLPAAQRCHRKEFTEADLDDLLRGDYAAFQARNRVAWSSTRRYASMVRGGKHELFVVTSGRAS